MLRQIMTTAGKNVLPYKVRNADGTYRIKETTLSLFSFQTLETMHRCLAALLASF